MPSADRIHQPYGLDLPGLSASVLSFTGHETVDEPYRFVVDVTSVAAGAALASLIGSHATFRIRPVESGREALVARYGNLASLVAAPARAFAGVVTAIEDVGEHGDESHYRVTLEPRLARLAGHTTSRLFQHASVPEIIEAVLRHAGLQGHDFRFGLKDEYPRREYTTQYAENSLSFIQRLAADEGLWFRFEQRAHGEVVVFGDHDGARGRHEADLPYRRDAGLESVGDEAVVRLGVSHASVPGTVRYDDYNHRMADVALLAAHGHGTGPDVEHRWGLHHASPVQGARLTRLRHEAHRAAQTVYRGEGNAVHLGAGDVLRIVGAPYAEAAGGLFVTRVEHEGARDRAYRQRFRGMPAKRIYRPLADPAKRPRIAGVLPARVVAAGSETYAPLDGDGWYRVRLPFDLDTWSPGGSSRPVRFARPYAGAGYGHHFPLLDGTEVALAFTEGDPDRPMIVGALHDSQHIDPVRAPNRTRNLVRSAGGNELRFEDLRERRHVHLHTPHATSQLNLGHMVDSGGRRRGEGAELRTDGHASVRGGQGVLVSAAAQAEAGGEQLAMGEAIHVLAQAAASAKGLAIGVGGVDIACPDPAVLIEVRDGADELARPCAVMHAPTDVALAAGRHVTVAAQQDVSVLGQRDTGISAMRRLALAAGEKLSLCAQKLGIDLVALRGKLRIEASTDGMDLRAAGDICMTSAGGELRIEVAKAIVLSCGGASLRIADGTIELRGSRPVKAYVPQFRVMTAKAQAAEQALLAEPAEVCERQFEVLDDAGAVLPLTPYEIHDPTGARVAGGISDAAGRTLRLYTPDREPLVVKPV